MALWSLHCHPWIIQLIPPLRSQIFIIVPVRSLLKQLQTLSSLDTPGVEIWVYYIKIQQCSYCTERRWILLLTPQASFLTASSCLFRITENHRPLTFWDFQFSAKMGFFFPPQISVLSGNFPSFQGCSFIWLFYKLRRGWGLDFNLRVFIFPQNWHEYPA